MLELKTDLYYFHSFNRTIVNEMFRGGKCIKELPRTTAASTRSFNIFCIHL